MGIYDIEAMRLDGTRATMADYRGKALLIVNTASRCGYTPQYKTLQEVHEMFGGQGLAVLGFPSNDFGAQEPGSEAEIEEFCRANYGVTFDLFAKSSVKEGPTQNPLFKHLTNGAEPIAWNFEKFLVDRKGALAGRYKSAEKLHSDAMLAAIEKALAS